MKNVFFLWKFNEKCFITTGPDQTEQTTIDHTDPETIVFFRETTEEALLQRAASDVQTHFSQFPMFEPLSLFIATWDNVAAYGGDASMVRHAFI